MTQRQMITGTEGNEDYMVCARKGGYILGIKPLLAAGGSNVEFGFRLRLQKAEGDEDIQNTKADSEGMLEVFTDIPWMKRSETRFSTVLMQSIAYGIGFLDKVHEQIKETLPGLLDGLAEKFTEDEKFMNRPDVEAFLMESYIKATEEISAYIKQQEAGAGAHGTTEGGDVVQFPGGDDDDL